MEPETTHPKKSVGQVPAWVLFCIVRVNLALSLWYFVVTAGEKTDIFLGLAPNPSDQPVAQKNSIFRSLTFRSVGMVGAVIVGFVMGTHPALAPEKSEFSSYLKKIPILSAFHDFGEKQEAKVSRDPRAAAPPPLLTGAFTYASAGQL